MKFKVWNQTFIFNKKSLDFFSYSALASLKELNEKKIRRNKEKTQKWTLRNKNLKLSVLMLQFIALEI